jgi:hypothetical protein
MPASFISSPQLETTALYLPLHFSVPETTVLRRPRPPSVPTAAAYKRSPFLAEKIHTIPSDLPDILLSLLALSIELSGVGRAPSTPHVPDISEAPPTCRLPEPAEKTSLHRQDTLLPVAACSGEPPQPLPPPRLPLAMSRRAGEEDPHPIPIRS